MSVIRPSLTARLAAGTGAVVLAGAVAAATASAGPAAGTSRAAAAGPKRTVVAALIRRPARTLAPGSPVPARDLGQRVFPNVRHGFALAAVGQAQYPAASADGGRTWHTDGPALHLNAAQAPLAVSDLGAAGNRVVFAYGGGQVVDTTGDGGRHWYRATFNGVAMAVVTGVSGHLVAFVDGSVGRTGVTWQYVSRDHGRTWHYTTAVGGR